MRAYSLIVIQWNINDHLELQFHVLNTEAIQYIHYSTALGHRNRVAMIWYGSIGYRLIFFHTLPLYLLQSPSMY